MAAHVDVCPNGNGKVVRAVDGMPSAYGLDHVGRGAYCAQAAAAGGAVV